MAIFDLKPTSNTDILTSDSYYITKNGDPLEGTYTKAQAEAKLKELNDKEAESIRQENGGSSIFNITPEAQKKAQEKFIKRIEAKKTTSFEP